jgi:hypothetical protein
MPRLNILSCLMKYPVPTLLLLSFFSALQLNAQGISAQVVDQRTKVPIPHASILFSENRGTVTNEEGVFRIPAEEIADSLQIISMGYEALWVKTSEIGSAPLLLKPASIELREVFLSNKEISAKELVEKVKEHIASNYHFEPSTSRIFLRQTNSNHIRKFGLEVDKSTIAGIDQKLMDQIIEKIPAVSTSYKEVLADVHGNYKGHHLNLIKAANLENPQQLQSLDQLTEHLETLFRKNLKPNSYLKIRSGWIGKKVKAKELEEAFAEADKERREKTAEDLQKEKEENRKQMSKTARTNIEALLKNMFWMENGSFNVFQKSGRYKFSLEGYTHLEENTVYILKFEPGRRGDFRGKMYVDAMDYGVHHLEYENVRPLKSFSLFGVSMKDDVYRGRLSFKKDNNGIYRPRYLEQESGETFGLDRPLTIIEKNRHVKGRNKQNELDLDIDLRMSTRQKLQLVVYEMEALKEPNFEVLPQTHDFEFETFRTYNPDFWKGYNILEPNAAIKKFTALEVE